jgi:serine/threonine protein kinase
MIKSGERIGQYLIQGTLGSGGMAVVYRALDDVTGRLVALKCIQKTDESLDIIARFKREALLLAKLKHPNIVEVFEFVELSDVICFAMELVEGDSLESLFFRNRVRGEIYPKMDEKALFPILVDICRAMAVAHSSKIFHRDIKPANVIVETATSRTVLLDFGLARGGGADTLTKTGAVLGTLNYLAPEQIKAGRISGYTDVYQWGIVAYHLLSGHLPFEEDDDVTGAIKRTVNEVPSVSIVAPQISVNLANIIDRSTRRLPLDRFNDGAELLAALIPNGPQSELSFPFRPSRVSITILNNESLSEAGTVKSSCLKEIPLVEDGKLPEVAVKKSKHSEKKSKQVKKLVLEDKLEGVESAHTVPLVKNVSRKRIVRFVWLTVLGCVLVVLLLSGKSIAPEPELPEISLTRLQPPMDKIFLESVSGSSPALEELALSFSTVLPSRVELCFIKSEDPLKELEYRDKPVSNEMAAGVASSLSAAVFGCRHKLKFESVFLKRPLFLRFILKGGKTLNGPLLDIKNILCASSRAFSDFYSPAFNEPEDFFNSVNSRFKELCSEVDSRAIAREKMSEELSCKYLEVDKEYERVRSLIPWVLDQKRIDYSYKKQVAISYCLFRYLPVFAFDEGFPVGDVRFPDSPPFFACTNSSPFNFEFLARFVFDEELKLYHRGKIIGTETTEPEVLWKVRPRLECNVGIESFDKTSPTRAVNHKLVVSQWKGKLVELNLRQVVVDLFLKYDFLAIELNMEDCDKGFWPIAFVGDIPLLFYARNSNIDDGGKIVHTFPSCLLNDSTKIKIRVLSPPTMVDSQNMLVHSVTFTGYKIK